MIDSTILENCYNRKDFYSKEGEIKQEYMLKDFELIQDDDGYPPPIRDSLPYLWEVIKQQITELWQRTLVLLTIFAVICATYGYVIWGLISLIMPEQTFTLSLRI